MLNYNFMRQIHFVTWNVGLMLQKLLNLPVISYLPGWVIIFNHRRHHKSTVNLYPVPLFPIPLHPHPERQHGRRMTSESRMSKNCCQLPQHCCSIRHHRSLIGSTSIFFGYFLILWIISVVFCCVSKS